MWQATAVLGASRVGGVPKLNVKVRAFETPATSAA